MSPRRAAADASAAQLAPGFIRTLIPFIVGPLALFLSTKLGLDVEQYGESVQLMLTAALSSLFGFLYYAGARFLEVYANSKWGYILGIARTPIYAEPPATVRTRRRTHRVTKPEDDRER